MLPYLASLTLGLLSGYKTYLCLVFSVTVVGGI